MAIELSGILLVYHVESLGLDSQCHKGKENNNLKLSHSVNRKIKVNNVCENYL
jgi:hypothetical protein